MVGLTMQVSIVDYFVIGQNTIIALDEMPNVKLGQTVHVDKK